MDKRYRIELNERQLRVIYDALEEYFRTAIGQFGRMADRLVFGARKDIEPEEMGLLWETSTHARKAMDAAYDIATDRRLVKRDDEDIAVDMWHVLLDEILYEDRPKFRSQQSDEPPIKVEAID